MTGGRNVKKGYVPNIDGFFFGGNKRTLDEIIKSSNIEQEKIYLKESDVSADANIMTVYGAESEQKSSCVSEAVVRALLANMRISMLNGQRLVLYYRNSPVCAYDIFDAHGILNNKNKGRKRNFVEQIFIDTKGIESETVQKQGRVFVAVHCPLQNSARVNGIYMDAVAEYFNSEINIIRCGLVKNFQKVSKTVLY